MLGVLLSRNGMLRTTSFQRRPAGDRKLNDVIIVSSPSHERASTLLLSIAERLGNGPNLSSLWFDVRLGHPDRAVVDEWVCIVTSI